MRKLILIALFCGGISIQSNAQEFHMPQNSPLTHLQQNFSTSFIQVDYSRPSLKGRELFGHQIPYGQPWRTGANDATVVTFGEEVIIGETHLKPGAYALYTIPNQDNWTVIFNTGIDKYGAKGFNPDDDVARITIPIEKETSVQETFRISIEDITWTTANIVLRWGNLKISVPVVVDNQKRILAYLDKELNSENPPYGAAASYYLATGIRLKEALEYTDIDIKKNPGGFYLYWRKAEILEKLGQHDEAIEAAKTAVDKTQNAPAFTAEYKQHLQDLIEKK